MDEEASIWDPSTWWPTIKQWGIDLVKDTLKRAWAEAVEIYTEYGTWLTERWEDVEAWILDHFPQAGSAIENAHVVFNQIDLFFPLHEALAYSMHLLLLYLKVITFRAVRGLLPKWLGGR